MGPPSLEMLRRGRVCELCRQTANELRDRKSRVQQVDTDENHGCLGSFPHGTAALFFWAWPCEPACRVLAGIDDGPSQSRRSSRFRSSARVATPGDRRLSGTACQRTASRRQSPIALHRPWCSNRVTRLVVARHWKRQRAKSASIGILRRRGTLCWQRSSVLAQTGSAVGLQTYIMPD
jgi:hypothetical protein